MEINQLVTEWYNAKVEYNKPCPKHPGYDLDEFEWHPKPKTNKNKACTCVEVMKEFQAAEQRLFNEIDRVKKGKPAGRKYRQRRGAMRRKVEK